MPLYAYHALTMKNEVTIQIEEPQALAGKSTRGQRIPIGTPGDYKLCVAQLPDGTLLAVAFAPLALEERKVREEILLFRSTDGGSSWSRAEYLTSGQGVLGREPYFTILKDGTVLITVHFLPQDVRNPSGYTRSFVHRSVDGGASWATAVTEPEGMQPGMMVCTSRNILEMQDGSLLLGVSGAGSDASYVWRSYDKGATWSEKYPAKIEELSTEYPWPFFGEGVWWQVPSGKVLLIARLDAHFVGRFTTEVPEAEFGRSDNLDRMILYRSEDEGHTFTPVRPFGGLGEMYPALLRLQDGRLLITFTVRSIRRPLGVRAVVGIEAQDDIEVDLGHDRFMLDTQTADEVYSGGGFGRTVQLGDGTLVTSYSWRDAEFVLHSEVMRWKLP